MSAESLGLLADEDALWPAQRFAELAADHLALRELTGHDLEAALKRSLVDLDRCATVIGPSGAGKSSLIAAIAEQLPDDRPVLRIPVATLREAAVDNVEFLRHLLLESRRLFDAHADRTLRDKLDEAATSSTTRVRRTGGLGVAFQLPPIKGVGVELAGQLRSATEGAERERHASDLREMLDGLLRLFASKRLSPVLVFEDTDQWLGRDDRGSKVANAFFAGPLRMLAREIEVTTVVAVHPYHGRLDGYRSLRDCLDEHHLPALRPPRLALEKIFAHRARCAGVDDPIDDLLTRDALVRLEGEYDRDRNLRRTLLIAHLALLASGPPYPRRLDVDAVREAANELGAGS